MATNDIARPPTAHIHVPMRGTPTIIEVGNDRYAVQFGNISFHVTLDDWNAIDAAVRAGIAAAGRALAL